MMDATFSRVQYSFSKEQAVHKEHCIMLTLPRYALEWNPEGFLYRLVLAAE